MWSNADCALDFTLLDNRFDDLSHSHDRVLVGIVLWVDKLEATVNE